MRIDKKEFCDFLKLFQDMADTNEKIADILMVDRTHYDVITDKLYNIFLKLCDLDPILEDDLDYYCFDLNFGMNWRPNMITDVNGNDIPFSNPIEVYEYLTGGKEE